MPTVISPAKQLLTLLPQGAEGAGCSLKSLLQDVQDQHHSQCMSAEYSLCEALEG